MTEVDNSVLTELDDSAPGALASQPVLPWTSAAKRALDIVIGIPLCLLALPVLLVLAVILAFFFRANPLFMHKRVGRGGKLISIPKLRTLPPDTHPYADKTVVDLKAPHPLAAFLRSRHLDELPQVFLVPIGRMSLVGPRPLMAAEAEAHADPAYNAVRTSMRQGCTGLWQVSKDTALRVTDRPEYDLLYVSQGTVRLDLWILWRTLYQALGGSSGVQLADVPRWLWRDPKSLRALSGLSDSAFKADSGFEDVEEAVGDPADIEELLGVVAPGVAHRRRPLGIVQHAGHSGDEARVIAGHNYQPSASLLDGA